MIIRPYTPADHPRLAVWWSLHHWDVIEQVMLPPDGFVVEADGIAVCAGFLYLTNSPFAWLEFVVANPLCDKLLRGKALDLLIAGLIARAKDLGKSSIFTTVNHPGLQKRYESQGGQVVQKNMTNIFWRLDGDR